MEEEKEALSLKARLLKISNEIRVKKDGENTYSNYSYFTPDGILNILNPLLDLHGVFSHFTLERKENSYIGKLELSDVNSDDKVCYEMESPEITIKATNPVQSLGGLQTYLKRYLLMNAFNIADNKDDYDSDNMKDKKNDVLNKKEADKIIKVTFDAKKLSECKTEQELTNYFNSLIEKDKKDKDIVKQFTERKTAING